MELEDATTTREEEYFVTERTQTYAASEQNYGFGTTLRRLNMLSSQQSYDMSFYMKGEGHRDSDGTLIQHTSNPVVNSTTVNFGSAINSRIEVGDEVLGTNLDTAPTIVAKVSTTQITLSHAVNMSDYRTLTFEGHDGIVLENGTGNVLIETPKYEGIRISDYENYFPRRYSDEYEKSFANKRTNLTYSAYVKSG